MVSYSLFLFLVQDWIGGVHEFDLKEPQWAKNTDVGCGWCGALMAEFRGNWWVHAFKRYHCTKDISDYPGALFPNLPMKNRRYDWMHGDNTLLSHLLSNCITLFSTRENK